MRIAVSGAHRTGKTTLVEELHRALPDYRLVDEPYHLLAERGHEFAEMPSLSEFELQLECSIECIVDSNENTIFDRCPADMLAYLVTHRDSEGFDVERWLSRSRNAIERLDFIVYVPIEEPDRMSCQDEEDADLRIRVDEELRDVLLTDTWDFGRDVIEVMGTTSHRLSRVLAHIRGS